MVIRRNIIALIFTVALFSCSEGVNESNKTPISKSITWEQTAALGKRVDILLCDFKDNVFAGVTYGGIYRSSNNGGSWTKLNSGVLNILNMIKSICVNSKGDIFVTSGQIYRSTDTGMSWIEVSNNRIRADNLLLGSNDEIIANSDATIYRSSDDGDSWTITENSMQNFSHAKLKLNSKEHLFAKTDQGIYKSMDKGISWNKLKDGYTYSLTINKNDDIYAIIGTAQSKSLFISKDDGANWTRISDVTITDIIINEKNILFGINGTIGLVSSNDGGITWKEINNGLAQKFVRQIIINSKGYIFAGTASYDNYSQLEKGEIYKSKESTID